MLLNDVRPNANERAERASPPVVRASCDTIVERHGYRAPASSRWLGLCGTILLAIMVIAVFLFAISTTFAPPPQATLTVLNLAPRASPPQTPPREKPAHEPVQKEERPETPPKRVVTIAPVSPVPAPVPASLPKAAERPAQPEEAALRTFPAPPAPQVASNDAESWEGRVLAQLNKYRRYPRSALLRRRQGVPYVRFVMDRDGNVLSSTLERSSGVVELDREAVSLPERAEPLPKPPGDKPGTTLELVVPVEFFVG
ncbi:TonB family protein [Sphingobium sp. HBC34]|uniref:TonB family protein n=1 Tax=Sphingobium cyanobacteriorum TaxID=3063954 RepID=A0ABT8ZPA2_9SPHN|nr:TonB family protein [Sphingobium sp. HBC34]MDO7836268.1 TonB family protein [Sphingobium sp. HBC34]